MLKKSLMVSNNFIKDVDNLEGEGSINFTQISVKFANGQKYETADMGEPGVKKSKNVQTSFMDGPILKPVLGLLFGLKL